MGSGLEVWADSTAVTPGVPASVPFRVRSLRPAPTSVSVRVVGIDPEWAPPPVLIGPIGTDEELSGEVTITLPGGFPACEHLAGFEATPVDPVTGTALGPAQ